MQHPEDFVYEFFQILEHRIAEWANSLGVHTYLGNVDLRNPLECFANYAHFAKRNEYCPLVFNPTPNWNYLPDLEKEGIGFIANDYLSFFRLMPDALNHYVRDDVKKRWFG